MRDDSVANGAKWVVDACAARGYRIAMATAGCAAPYVKQYLATRVEPDQWTKDVLDSDAFQGCQPVKSYSLPLILQHFGLSSTPGCAVLFDQGFNKKFADETGISFADVDERYGLQRSDFAEAEAQLLRNCPM